MLTVRFTCNDRLIPVAEALLIIEAAAILEVIVLLLMSIIVVILAMLLQLLMVPVKGQMVMLKINVMAGTERGMIAIVATP